MRLQTLRRSVPTFPAPWQSVSLRLLTSRLLLLKTFSGHPGRRTELGLSENGSSKYVSRGCLSNDVPEASLPRARATALEWRRVRAALAHETFERLVEGTEERAALASERAVGGTRRGEFQFTSRTTDDKPFVEPGQTRRATREVGPRDRARVREVPNAALAVDEQVEAGV